MDNRSEQAIELWSIPKIGDYRNWYWTTTTKGEMDGAGNDSEHGYHDDCTVLGMALHLGRLA